MAKQPQQERKGPQLAPKLVEDFAALLAGASDRSHIVDTFDDIRTVKKPATPQDFADHLSGKTSLGLTPVNAAGTCQFGAIDVDVDKIDHRALAAEVRRRRMPLTVCRSRSGGARHAVRCHRERQP